MAGFGISFLLTLFLNIEMGSRLVVASSFVTILLIISMDRILKKFTISFSLALTINYVSVFGISIAVVSAIALTCYIFFPELPLPPLNFIYLFFLIISIFSPIFLVLIAFSYPVFLGLRALREKWIKSLILHHEDFSTNKTYLKRKTWILFLSLIILLSIIVSMIPYLSIVNEDNTIIGTDTKNYIIFLETIAESSGYEEVFYKAFVTIGGGDRPISMLFLYWLYFTFFQDNFYSLLKNLPLILGPFLVISVYLFTFNLTKNHLTSLFASLITIPSHILIGIYAGLYANWFALIWGYLALIFLFKLIEKPERFNILIFSALIIVVLFSHSQTWTIFIYVIGLFTVVLFFKNKKENTKTVKYILIAILPSIIVEVFRLFLTNFSGVSQEISFAMNREVGLHGLSTIWDNLINTSHLYLAGQIANPIILLLIIYWLYITKIKTSYVIFLIVFFSLYTIPILFADAAIQARFFYEIPFQVPAAIALTVLRERTGNYLPFVICLWLVVMSIYMTRNFVLVIPQ
jgi:hypothetical protein